MLNKDITGSLLKTGAFLAIAGAGVYFGKDQMASGAPADAPEHPALSVSAAVPEAFDLPEVTRSAALSLSTAPLIREDPIDLLAGAAISPMAEPFDASGQTDAAVVATPIASIQTTVAALTPQSHGDHEAHGAHDGHSAHHGHSHEHGAHDHPHEAAAHPAADVPACVADLQLIAERARITFSAGSTLVTSEGRDRALVMAALAEACPQAHVTILGFTDPSGTEELNLRISTERAENVLNLIRANGYALDRIVARSHVLDHINGATCPHFDVVDRRVEFIVTPINPVIDG